MEMIDSFDGAMEQITGDKTITEKETLLHLKNIQKLVAEAVTVGFNQSKGEWAEGLFYSNQKTSDIRRQYTGSYNGKSLEEI